MRDEVLSLVLAADKDLSRDEPEVAANIGAQLEHMALTTWSISVRRRIRDSIARLQPNRIMHSGAGIGHLSAWLLDHLEGVEWLEEFQLIEEGNRFAVILKRLCDRYSDVPTSIKVGKVSMLAAEMRAWSITREGDAPLLDELGAIVVESPLVRIAGEIESLLPLLAKDGVLFTVEPEPPVGDRSEDDPEVVGFNSWMELIRNANETHHLAFAPLFGGTIVAFLPRV